MRFRKNNRLLTNILTYVIIFLSVVFFISPIIWILYCSFRTQASIFTGELIAPLEDLTLENYITIFSVTDFPLYFWNSLRISTIVSICSLILASIGAYGLSRFKIRGKNIIIMGIFSTQMLPQVLLIIPLFLIIFSLKLLDTTMGVVFLQLILVLPFSVWMLKGYFDGIPQDIENSARIDGCNTFQTLIYIVFPMVAPGILVAGLTAGGIKQ
jgi:ABC-type glycerol-3-phosphate transport system permease component